MCVIWDLGKIGNWKKLEKEFKNVEFIYILSYDSLNHSNRFIHPSPLNLLTKSVQLASKLYKKARRIIS